MNNITPILKLFEEFQNKSCSEMFYDYMKFSDTRNTDHYIRACFVISYCCALFKDINSAYIWRSAFRKAIGVRSDKEESLNNEKAIAKIILPKEQEKSLELYALEDMFIETHIMFNRLDFASAYETIRFGLAKSLEIGSTPFALFFMVMKGWLDIYLGNYDDASDNFRLAASFIETHQELNGCNGFFSDMVTAGKCFLNSEDSSYLNNLWARYYHNELSWIVRMRNHERPEVFKPDFYKDIFGNMTCGSSFDKILATIEASYAIDTLGEDYSKLSPNQKLYCEILTGRPLNLSGINRDSFIIASSELCTTYELCIRQDSWTNAAAILNAYDTYIRNSGFQLDLSATLPLLKNWIEGKGSVRELISFTSVTGLPLVTYTQETAVMHRDLCVENLKHIRNLPIGLTEAERLELSICIYKLTDAISQEDEEYNNYIKGVISPLSQYIKSQYNTSGSFDGSLSSVKIAEEYKTFVPNGFPAMLDNEIIRSVIISINIENQEFIERLMNYAGESCDRLPEYERVYVESFIGDIFNETEDGLATSSVVSHGLYLKVNVTGFSDFSEFYIYLFSRGGRWHIEDGNYWKNNQSERILSPLKIIANSEECKRNAPIIFLLMSGVEIDEFEFTRQTGAWNIRLYKIPEIKAALIPDTANSAEVHAESQIKKQVFLESVFSAKPDIMQEVKIESKKNRTEQLDWNFFALIDYINKCNVCTRDMKVFGFTDKIPERIKSFGLTQLLIGYAEDMSEKTPDFKLRYNAQFIEAPYAFSIEIISDSAKVSLNSFVFHNRHPFSNSENYLVNAPFYDTLRHAIHFEPSIDKAEKAFVDKLYKYSKQLESCREAAIHVSFLKSSVQIFARKSARIAIMARNMSHNLGSHVMAYLKQHLNTMSDMLRNRVFDRLFYNEDEYNTFLNDPQKWFNDKGLKNDRNIELPFLTGLGKFISYIQERQDFIASIATDYSPAYSTLNFKDYIYDELNIDKRTLRHKDRQGIMPDNILLSNIARSEGLQREPYYGKAQEANDIVLKFRSFNGDIAEDESSMNDLDDMRKYFLSIPGGVTGRHALFTIIENIIRNAAKHGDRTGTDSLELTFDFYDTSDITRSPDSDNYESEYSLRKVFENYYCNASDASDYYYLTITDNYITSYADLLKIRKVLVEDYVDEEGIFQEGSKGLKEIRICAAWLRNQQVEFYVATKDCIDKADSKWLYPEQSDTIPTLYVRLSDNHLQYIIALKKPKEVLLVSSSFCKDINSRLLSHHWLIMTPEEFESGGGELNFEFIILDGDYELYHRLRWKSNCRMFMLSDIPGMSCDKLSELANTEDKELTEKLRYYKERILWRLSGYEEGDKITISDEKAKSNFEKRKEDPELIKYLDVNLENGYSDYSYIKHYETSFVDIKKITDDLDEKKRFIEGISGANSTDRLIRCEPLNVEWFCKHLHAMKQRVAIFDERLSNKLLEIRESDMLANERCNAAGYNGVMFADKGVWIFNMVKSLDDKSFIIYGISPEKELTTDYKHSVCVKLAVVSYNGKRVTFEFTESGKKFKGYFDRLSIHQGLLDKLYNVFEIKSDKAAKEQLTKLIYENFHTSCNKEILTGDDGHYLLPGMSIHSGRSKPGAEDMPQRLPFIQYASLEHAVLDCKYVLTELLDTITINYE